MTMKPCARNYYLAIGLAILLTLIFVLVVVFLANPDAMTREEVERDHLFAMTINLRGTIVDERGVPVHRATVSFQDRDTITSGNGSFSLDNLARKNGLLIIESPGYRKEFIPVSLVQPSTQSERILDPISLTAADPGEVRFLFGGDTHFGRRYIDPWNITPRDTLPPDNPDALINASDPGPGTRTILRFIKPYFAEADWGSVNLESPVTGNVSTPNQEKQYVLLTLPGSLPALREIGVSYVSLGNNHVYDYLDAGLMETLNNLDAAGIAHSGAGSNTPEAFSAYHITLKGTPYSFLSMTSIDGSENVIHYVANESKGGAANLKDSSMVFSAIVREGERGYIPIVQVHGGDEYTYSPPEYISGRVDLVTYSGARLVISHHPHIAQGVRILNDAVVIEGLGNLAFDAERHETKLGLLARVDMKGREVRSVRLIPISIVNFTPVPVSGEVADLLLRRVGESSRDSPYPVYPYSGQGWVALGMNEAAPEDRPIVVNVTVPDSGSTVLDLRQLARSSESLAEVKDATSASLGQVGRDLMMYGDFEDWDTDEIAGENDYWDLAENSSLLTVSQPFRGTQSLLSIRNAKSRYDSVIPFRNRIRVMGDARNQTPNKNLTFLGYIRGQDAGNVRIMAKYLASEGEMTFGEEEILSLPGGSFPWQQYTAEIHMPADNPKTRRDPTTDPRALQIIIRHAPSEKNQSIAGFDDIAVISWEEGINLSAGAVLRTPHARDFLRITGSPGIHQLTLTFRSYSPNFLGTDISAG